MGTTHSEASAVTRPQSSKKGLHFLERLLICARARCSYVGCSRLRHTGPCHANPRTDALHTRRDEMP
jgi:hypothetical protein